jgi:PAS domain-containing protein
VYTIVKRVASRARVSAHPHSLRAAFAVQFDDQNPREVIALKELLGHSRIETTMVYLRRKDKARAMEQVRGLSWLRSSAVMPPAGFEPEFPAPHDREMRYVAVNAYACELLGCSEEELLTMRVTDIASQSEAPEEYSTLMATAYLRGVSRLRCKDGEELSLRYVAGEVDIDGEAAYVSVGYVEFASSE